MLSTDDRDTAPHSVPSSLPSLGSFGSFGSLASLASLGSLASLDSWCFFERFYATKARSASTLFFFFKVTVGFSFAVISNTFSTHHYI